MLIYDIFIAPIELVIEFIFQHAYSTTGNYLIATILLSLIVSTILLPFYYWAGSLQNKEKEIFTKLKPTIDEFKRVYKGSELHAVTRILYRQNNYHPIYSLRSLAGLLIQLPFFIAAYNFLSHYEAVNGIETFLFDDLGAPDAWLIIGSLSVNIMPFIMTIINLLASFLYLKESTKNEKIQLWALALIFLILLYNSPSILLLYWTCNNLFYLLKNVLDNKIIPKIYTKRHALVVQSKRQIQQNKLILLSLLISSFLLFILPTVQIIASSPGEFSSRGILIGVMFYFFLLSFFSLSFIIIKMNGAVKRFFSFISLFICFNFLTNFFVFGGDYGIMDFFVFHRPDMLENSSLALLNNVFTFVILFFLTGLSLSKIPYRFLFMGLSFVSVMLVFSGLSSLAGIVNYSEDNDNSDFRHIKFDEIEPKFYFSQHGKNVLIILFDRFIGGLVPDILKDVPNLRHELTGFTWYPNTLSLGPNTSTGLAPIYGGYKFCDIALRESKYDWLGGWKHHGEDYMQKRFFESTSFIVKKFVDAGYRSFINDPSWLDPKKVDRISRNSHSENLIGRYRDIFFPDSMVSLEDSGRSPISLVKQYLLPFSFFKVSPSSMRKELYNNGRWWNEKKSGIDNKWINSYLDNLSLALAWPLISKVDEKLKGSFLFTTNNMTHDTYAARDNGKVQTAIPKNNTIKSKWKVLISDDALIPQKDLKRFKNSLTAVHFYSSKEALIRTAAWIKWMKKNRVYDNTKIVIVSDHGRNGVYNPMFNKQESKDKFWYGGYHPVFMTKDFNAAGDLETDNSFMTNADVPSIVLSAVEPDAKKKYGFDKAKGFRIYTRKGNLTVKDNIFVPGNWVYQP